MHVGVPSVDAVAVPVRVPGPGRRREAGSGPRRHVPVWGQRRERGVRGQ